MLPVCIAPQPLTFSCRCLRFLSRFLSSIFLCIFAHKPPGLASVLVDAEAEAVRGDKSAAFLSDCASFKVVRSQTTSSTFPTFHNTHVSAQTGELLDPKMSVDNCDGNVSVPLRNLLNSVQCIRDRVRDGESNESHGEFNLSNFWDTLNQAVKAVSQEATKLSLAFSKPPLPSEQDGEKLSESIMKTVLALSTVYYWLPKSQGVCMRRQVRDATVEVLEGIMQLLEVILSSPLQSLSQEQLTSTGSVWSACDRFTQLAKDNKSAVLVVLSSQIGVVKDALEEVEQALSEAQDPFNDVLDDVDADQPRDNQDTYWSEKDRRVIGPCQGLMKASAACIRKLTSAVRANGDVTTAPNLSQLDDLADVIKEISPGVDDLALCLYPPMDYSGVESNASALAGLLKKVLEIIRFSHVCGESELTWVQFLNGAVDHNLQRARELIQQDS